MKWILLAPLMLIGTLLALGLLVMLLRVGAGASYRNGQPSVWVKIWFVNIQLYPRRKRRKRKKDKRGKQKVAKSKKAQRPNARVQESSQSVSGRHQPSPQKQAKPAAQPAAGRQGPAVEEICTYMRFGIDAGGQLLRGLCIDKLYLRADIGTPDAAKTALAYGGASAAVSNLWPLMESLFTIRKRDIFLNACFEQEQTTIEGEIVITAMVGRMAIIGLRIFRQFTKMKKAVQANEQSQ